MSAGVSATSRATLKAPTTPKIFKVSLPLADTEYSQALDSGTVQFRLRLRDSSVAARLRVAFNAGDTDDSPGLYYTVDAGCEYEESGLTLSGKTLYIRCNKPGQIAEVLQWT